MRKFLALFFLGCLGIIFEMTLAASLTSITGGGNVLLYEVTKDEATALSIEDLTITGDFGTAELVTLGFNSGTGDLNFSDSGSSINFFTTSGDVMVSNITAAADQVSFEVTGSGSLQILGMKVFVSNADTEFFEKRRLSIQMDGNTYLGEDFVVDTTRYWAYGELLGYTGGSSHTIFKIGDTISYDFGEEDFSSQGIFTMDLSEISGSSSVLIADGETIVEGSFDGVTSFPILLTYDGTTIMKSFKSGAIWVDNIRPHFETGDLQLRPITSGETVAGIGVQLVFVLPVDTSGDELTFSVDFSDVAGSIAIFEKETESKVITLLEGTLDEVAYSKEVQIWDDAGNTFSDSEPLMTNEIGVDLQRPIIESLDLLSILDGGSIAQYGSFIQVKTPIDTFGDMLTFSIDLSSMGGSVANFIEVESIEDFMVELGTLENENFSADFTVYDEAGNTSTFIISTTNTILVNNKPPEFDTSCGAVFSIIDQGDTNGWADLSAGEADSVIFTAPNKNLSGCSELNTFSIDLSGISGDSVDNLIELDADGGSYLISVASGDFDGGSYSFPIRVFDEFGNYSDFTSGSLSIDNNVPEESDLIESSETFRYASSDADLALYPSDVINVKVSFSTTELASLTAQIEGATKEISLTETDGEWIGDLTIDNGLFDTDLKQIFFSGIDTSENIFSFSGEQTFYITNDITDQEGGGGGSIIGRDGGVEREFFQGERTKKEQVWKEVITKEELFQEELSLFKDDEFLNNSTPKEEVPLEKLIEPLSFYDKFQVKMRLSRKKIEAFIDLSENPDRMAQRIKKVSSPKISKKEWEKNEDKIGGFRLRNSLKKITKARNQKKSKKSIVTLRKSVLSQRGKYGEIQFTD